LEKKDKILLVTITATKLDEMFMVKPTEDFQFVFELYQAPSVNKLRGEFPSCMAKAN
jgi:hypothetical protein